MSDLECHDFKSALDTKHPVQLFLCRKENRGRMPVLLVHGASASHETFTTPGPDPQGLPRCLADWLHQEGFEPWLLDWRGSGKVVETALRDGTLGSQRDPFDFDSAARWDIPGALERIREVRGREQIAAIGHCMGAGTLAQAIASGTVTREQHGLTHVVLLTLGLFYEPPFDSRLKTQDHALERVLDESKATLVVDPQRKLEPWPQELEELYRNWPPSLRPHPDEERSDTHEMCDRLSFMYGTPYLERNLVPEIHCATWTVSFDSGTRAPLVGDAIDGGLGSTGILRELVPRSGSWGGGDAAGALVLESSGTFRPGQRLKVGGRVFARSRDPIQSARVELPQQFGAIPLRMYAQGAKNVRRRWAGTYQASNEDVSLIGSESRGRFDALEGVTLITGAKNQLWHRDSIDRMYEWLTRGSGRQTPKVRKRVLRDYGHQDLLWGKDARKDVFPEILDGLRPPT